MYPKFRSKDDPNHSGADDGLHVWERPSGFEDVSEEEMIEMWNVLAKDGERKRRKRRIEFFSVLIPLILLIILGIWIIIALLQA